jgi:hypothetical protein
MRNRKNYIYIYIHISTTTRPPKRKDAASPALAPPWDFPSVARNREPTSGEGKNGVEKGKEEGVYI